MLVRLRVHGIRDYFCVLRVRNQSVAAYLYRHGPAPARHGTQRARPRRLAESNVTLPPVYLLLRASRSTILCQSTTGCSPGSVQPRSVQPLVALITDLTITV